MSRPDIADLLAARALELGLTVAEVAHVAALVRLTEAMHERELSVRQRIALGVTLKVLRRTVNAMSERARRATERPRHGTCPGGGADERAWCAPGCSLLDRGDYR